MGTTTTKLTSLLYPSLSSSLSFIFFLLYNIVFYELSYLKCCNCTINWHCNHVLRQLIYCSTINHWKRKTKKKKENELFTRLGLGKRILQRASSSHLSLSLCAFFITNFLLYHHFLYLLFISTLISINPLFYIVKIFTQKVSKKNNFLNNNNNDKPTTQCNTIGESVF